MTHEQSPQIKACTLYQKTSGAGNTYFFGRSGALTYTLLLDKKAAEDGKDPAWNLLIAEAPAWQGDSQKTGPQVQKPLPKAPPVPQRNAPFGSHNLTPLDA